MITLTMKKEEIIAHVTKDNYLCKTAIKRISRDWKALSKNKCNAHPFYKEYEYYCEESMQRYFLLFAKLPNFHGIFRSRIAEVKDNNRTYYVVCIVNDQFAINIISSHCLSRYFERMHLERRDIKQDLSTFARVCIPNIPIYKQDERAVLATRDGLALCEMNKDAHTVIYRTFITKDLLKPSQRAALETIETEMMQHKKLIGICSTQQELEAVETIFSFKSKYKEEAEAIYSEYFEKL